MFPNHKEKETKRGLILNIFGFITSKLLNVLRAFLLRSTRCGVNSLTEPRGNQVFTTRISLVNLQIAPEKATPLPSFCVWRGAASYKLSISSPSSRAETPSLPAIDGELRRLSPAIVPPPPFCSLLQRAQRRRIGAQTIKGLLVVVSSLSGLAPIVQFKVYRHNSDAGKDTEKRG